MIEVILPETVPPKIVLPKIEALKIQPLPEVHGSEFVRESFFRLLGFRGSRFNDRIV
jgi:hypothetical protein